jgi:predicted unusual protein kinase regulating ubiquinone biosynthesis (AarF/ABC1/UbiB family)
MMHDGRLCWIDFGMAGWLDERSWALQLKLRIAIGQSNIDQAYRHMLTTLEPLPLRDLSGFEAETKEFLREWVEAGTDQEASLVEKSSGYFFVRLFDAIRCHGLTLPPGLSRLYRSLIIADMVMLKLHREIDWVSILKEQIAEEQAHILKQKLLDAAQPLNLALQMEAMLNFPKMLSEVSDWTRERLPDLNRNFVSGRSVATRLLMRMATYTSWLSLGTIVLAVAEHFFGPGLVPKAMLGDYLVQNTAWVFSISMAVFLSSRFLVRELEDA